MLAVLAASPAGAQPAASSQRYAPLPQTVVVTGGAFGTIEVEEDGTVSIQPTLTIPNRAGQMYAWVLKVEPQVTPIRWREEMETSVPALRPTPEAWPDGFSEWVSHDRRASVAKGVEPAGKTFIQQAWTLTEKEVKAFRKHPRAVHTLRVYLNDQLAETFKFRIK